MTILLNVKNRSFFTILSRVTTHRSPYKKIFLYISRQSMIIHLIWSTNSKSKSYTHIRTYTHIQLIRPKSFSFSSKPHNTQLIRICFFCVISNQTHSQTLITQFQVVSFSFRVVFVFTCTRTEIVRSSIISTCKNMHFFYSISLCTSIIVVVVAFIVVIICNKF